MELGGPWQDLDMAQTSLGQLLDMGSPTLHGTEDGNALLLLSCFTGSWVSAVHRTFLKLQHLSGSVQ